MSERLNRHVNAERVNIRIVQLGLTKREVAKQLEIQESTLYRNVSGKQIPSYTFMLGLAKVLKTSIEDLTLPASSDEDPPPSAA